MDDWDAAENFISSKGYFTIYSPNYENEMRNRIRSFDSKDLRTALNNISLSYESSLVNVREEGDEEEYNLVGLNSNSFTSSLDRHNLFMEWDEERNLPSIDDLEVIGGTVVETAGGVHLFKEADLSWEEVNELHKKWKCCSGFTEYSNQRKYACLRVCPKKDNYLNITRKDNSFICETYEKITETLRRVYDGVVG